MGLFTPNIEKLKASENVLGLVRVILKKRNPELVQVALNALIVIGEPAVEPLLNIIKQSDLEPYNGAVAHASKALGKIGKPAVDPLVEIISSPGIRSKVIDNACKALILTGEPAVEPLIKALKEVDQEFCLIYIVEALKELKDKRAVKPLIQKLGSKSSNLRYEVVLALGNISSEESIEPILNLALNDSASGVKKEAITVIKNSGKLAIPYLRKHLDSNMDNANEIAGILDSMGWKPEDETELIRFLLLRSKWDELVKVGANAVESIIRYLDSDDSNVKLNAIKTLGRIGDSKAIDPLIELLVDKNKRIRAKVVEALENFNDKKAQEKIKQIRKVEEEIASRLRLVAGSDRCVRCEQAKSYWTRKIIAKSGMQVQGLTTVSMPNDFAGVCTKCQDGFCKKHAPSNECPFCGSILVE